MAENEKKQTICMKRITCLESLEQLIVFLTSTLSTKRPVSRITFTAKSQVLTSTKYVEMSRLHIAKDRAGL